MPEAAAPCTLEGANGPGRSRAGRRNPSAGSRARPTRRVRSAYDDHEEGSTIGAQRTTFNKLQRERAKKAKAAAKRERRREKSEAPGTEDDATQVEAEQDTLPDSEVLERLDRVHRQFEADQISHEEFEEKKAQLLSHLTID